MAERLESRLSPATLTFRQGNNNYTGTQDTVLFSASAGTNFGTDGIISVDAQDGGGARHALIRFDDIFGNGPNQIPHGSTIFSASITIWCPNQADPNSAITLHRMNVPWQQSTATWFSLNNGVTVDGTDALSLPDAFFPPLGKNAFLSTGDLREAIQDWANGSPNYGWGILNDSSNGWDFHASEHPNLSQRPELRVDFEPPDPTGAGLFQLSRANYQVTESGGSVLVTVQRIGGSAGTVGVTLETTQFGSAVAGQDFTGVTQKLTFAPGVLTRTVSIPILDDLIVEGTETFGVQLVDATGGAAVGGFASSIVTILDQDLLLNEINVNPPGEDSPFEYVELRGTSGASLAGVFLLQIEGDSGANPGNVDVAIPLSSAKVGSNGLLMIMSPTGGFAVPPGTIVVTSPIFDTSGGGLENGTSTFMLVKSPTPIQVNDDLDPLDNGTLQLPPGATIIDNIGWTDGGTTDRVYNGTSLTPVLSRTAMASRFIANDTASSIAAWFGGVALETTSDGITYNLLNSTGNTPPGAKLTPGAPNGVPTSFAFAKAEYSIAENDPTGKLKLTVNRLGDISAAASVEFKLVGVTATAGSDFVPGGGKLTFAAQETVKTFEVSILDDFVAEADEIFNAVLFNPQGAAQAALGLPSVASITIVDNEATRAVFQNGLNGYAGTQDTYISGINPFANFGTEPLVTIDAGSKSNWGLIRFTDLSSQIPLGAKILGASLTVDVPNSSQFGASITLHRMLAGWDENTVNWQSLNNGVLPDNIQAAAVPDSAFPNAGAFGFTTVPNLGAAVQAWIDGAQENNGWIIYSNSDDAFAFVSANDTDPFKADSKPRLSVSYIPPVGGGFIQFAAPEFAVNEGAGTATIRVTRNGGVTGPVTVKYAVTAGTATAADAGLPSGTLTFAANQTVASFTIPIVNDTLVEGSETLNLALTDPTGGAVLGPGSQAKLVILDNNLDANLRLNEVLTNPPGPDRPYEFIELIGTPSSKAGIVSVAVVRSSGAASRGVADAVWTLDGSASGTNGLTMIRATAGGHKAAVGTSILATELFDDAGPGLTNGSVSLVLIHSPDGVIVPGIDYDWNNDGVLDLPEGAVVLDAIGWSDGTLNTLIYGADLTQFGYTPGGASRIRTNQSALDATAWYGGQVVNDGNGSASLLYNTAADKSFNLDLGGPRITPGSTNFPLLPQVAEVRVNDGSVQRSQVKSLTVTFNTVVNFDGPIAAAFKLARTGPTAGPLAGPTGVVGLTAAADSTTGQTIVTITFAAGALVETNGSIRDGNYTFQVISGKVTDGSGLFLDGDSDGMPGGDYNQPGGLRRLFGDTDGNGTVNFNDFLVFRGAFGTSQGNPGYLDYLNFNEDTTIDFSDYLQFRSRFGTSLI